MVAKELKIAQVVCSFPPYRGGMGNVAFNLADCLSQLKQEVIVFSPKLSSLDHDIKSYFRIYKLAPQFKYGNSAVVLQLCYLLLKYDIVHLHYPFLGASLATLFSKILKGKRQKLVVHYHMDLVGRDWKSLVYRLYNSIFLPLLARFADRILVTSQDYLKTSLIYKYYLKYQNKFFILPNGVDLDYFRPKPRDTGLVNKYGLAGKKGILFVGALDSAHYFKGVNYLLKAFETIVSDNLRLIIVGAGNLLKTYKDMAVSFGLEKSVIFTGYIPDADLASYYNLADVFVLPSIDKSEAFGMVLLEAMACAKPVIASDLSGVREVVRKRVNGLLVKPKNSQQLSEQLDYLLKHPKIGLQFGLNGRRIVEESYAWKNITEQLLKIYRL